MFVVIKIQLTFLRGTEVVCVSGNVFSFLEPIIYVLKEKEKYQGKEHNSTHCSTLKDNTPT